MGWLYLPLSQTANRHNSKANTLFTASWEYRDISSKKVKGISSLLFSSDNNLKTRSQTLSQVQTQAWNPDTLDEHTHRRLRLWPAISTREVSGTTYNLGMAGIQGVSLRKSDPDSSAHPPQQQDIIRNTVESLQLAPNSKYDNRIM